MLLRLHVSLGLNLGLISDTDVIGREDRSFNLMCVVFKANTMGGGGLCLVQVL